MFLNPMRIISASVNTEIVYLFLIYDYCDSRTTCYPRLVVSVSDYGTGGLGRFLDGHLNYSVFLFLLFFSFLCRITSYK